MKITHTIKMDLAQHQNIGIDVVQGCTAAYMLQFRLTENRVPWHIPADASAVIRYQKPNRKTGAYNTLEDGTCAYTIRDNTVTIAVAPDALTVPGKGALAVSLIREKEVLTTFAVTLQIQATPGYDSSLSDHPGCVTGLLTAPGAAEVGQYIVVESVNRDGKVTGTVAVDLPELDENEVREIISAYLDENPAPPGTSAYEYAVAGGYTGTEEEFAEKLAAESPAKLSDLENDLYYEGRRDALITLSKEDFSYEEEAGGWLYFGPRVGIADVQELGYLLSMTADGTTVEYSEAELPIVYSEEDGVYVVCDTIAFQELGPEEGAALGYPDGCFVGILASDYSVIDTLTLTLYSIRREKKIPQELVDINLPTLRITRNGILQGTYNGTEAKTVKINVPTQTSQLTNDSGFLTELPEALPNPHPLTINGISYDGSEAVEITVEGGSVSSGETQTVLSDNLFDKTSVTAGQLFYHSSTGPVLTDSTDVCWAYVPLRGAGTYRTKVNYQEHQTYANRVPILTEDKTFLQNVTGTVTETDNKYAADLEFTITQDMVDDGAALYAFDCHTSILSTVMIVKDLAYPSSYIPYGYIEVAVESGTLGDKLDNVLKGKTALFLGDSICAGTTVGEDSEYYGYGWGGMIGAANGMTWVNYGKNGGTIVPMESVAEARWLLTQADSAYSAHPEADYVIFEGGCNDADTMKADGLGTLSASGYAPESTADFTSAFESLVLKLLTNFPAAKIGYVIPQKMNVSNDYSAASNYERIYFDRAVEICEKWGIPVLDLWKTCPMNPKLSMFYDSSLTDEENCYTDGQHLTLKGYQRITPKIEAFMRSL